MRRAPGAKAQVFRTRVRRGPGWIEAVSPASPARGLRPVDGDRALWFQWLGFARHDQVKPDREGEREGVKTGYGCEAILCSRIMAKRTSDALGSSWNHTSSPRLFATTSVALPTFTLKRPKIDLPSTSGSNPAAPS